MALFHFINTLDSKYTLAHETYFLFDNLTKIKHKNGDKKTVVRSSSDLQHEPANSQIYQ